jgi:hypothetical protein
MAHTLLPPMSEWLVFPHDTSHRPQEVTNEIPTGTPNNHVTISSYNTHILLLPYEWNVFTDLHIFLIYCQSTKIKLPLAPKYWTIYIQISNVRRETNCTNQNKTRVTFELQFWHKWNTLIELWNKKELLNHPLPAVVARSTVGVPGAPGVSWRTTGVLAGAPTGATAPPAAVVVGVVGGRSYFWSCSR